MRRSPLLGRAPSRRRVLLVLAAPVVLTLVPTLLVPWIAASLAPHRGRVPDATTSARPRPRVARPALLPTPTPTGTPVTVIVTGRPAGRPVPPDFLGLSFEIRSLPAIAAYARGSASAPATAGDLVALLRSLGPGVLRFGGVSADLGSAWVSPGGALPQWASTAITGADLTGIAALARQIGWRVLLTVNLGHYDPAAAAREAAAAHALLGDRLAGIELGNEPDAYVRKRLRAPGWDYAAYRRQAAAYLAAIRAAAPGVPIAGPDASSGLPGLAWVRAAAATLHPRLLTDHYYPLSSCGAEPTGEELLSPTTRANESAMLARLAAIAHATATPLRLDEANNISCEGKPGVSDSFAAALWALDFTARAMAAGVAGIDFHDLIDEPSAYSPLVVPYRRRRAASPPGGQGALHANPEWYALLAARPLLGGRPLGVRVAGGIAGAGVPEAGVPTAGVAGASVAETAAGDMTASALRAPDASVRVVLVDYDPPGSRPLAVRLRVPGRFAGGSILRLTAPSPDSTGGVRLGGRAVAPAGSWSPPAALPGVYRRAGSLALRMPASSAAVVTLYPR
jgi:hypothetical protein